MTWKTVSVAPDVWGIRNRFPQDIRNPNIRLKQLMEKYTSNIEVNMIRNFFKPVDKRRYAVDNMIADINFDAQQKKDQDQREKNIAEKRRKLAASRATRNDAIRIKKAEIEEEVSPQQLIQREIDEIVVGPDEDVVIGRKRSRKLWSKRPINWIDIVEEANAFGSRQAFKSFPEEFRDLTDKASFKKINRWQKDAKMKKVGAKVRIPAYGLEIDNLVKLDFERARANGLPVDNVTLRRYLLVHLTTANMLDTLIENGGKYLYEDSWAIRFYKRHGIVSRVATTKMREIPADFEIKKNQYLKVASDLIYQHRVPPELVINGDETAVQLVNRANRTRNVRGAKRVRMLGVGEDKAQITTTIFVTESGDVLPYQMIFEGKTDRCHPKHVKPDDCVWTHTSSHWQSVATYCAVIEAIIVPYKNRVISNLGLSKDQVTILKHDLHFTHKDASVLEILKKHKIVPLFVPAGCTDIMQECDTVVNKPFKNGVRNEYRDHMDQLFQAHLRNGQGATAFAPKLTMGALKPFLTSFVQRGIEALKTPQMRETIKTAFANDGLFSVIRSPEMQLRVQLEGIDLANDIALDEVEIDAEIEEIDAEIAAISSSDSGSDSD